MNKFRTQLVVLSAPSGAGKTTIARTLAKRFKELRISISATTRSRRPGEREGRDYHFLTIDQFRENIRQKNFLEFEEVHGDFYGTLKGQVQTLLNEGYVVVFDIDVKGALAIKKLYPQAILIFIKPPSLAELKKRLRNRKSESDESIATRLQRIDYEYSQAEKFDHVIINDDLHHAVLQVENLIRVK
jgi:guanylate kinase